MAQAAGTSDTYDMKGKAEDFRDVIYTVAKEETPFQKLIGTDYEVTATKHQWQTDTLRAPATNAKPEGNETSFTEVAPTVEVSNYCQISDESFMISNTAEAVKKYGRKSEIKRQTVKKAKELVRDMEYSMVGVKQASSAGSAGTPVRQAGSLWTWLSTNANRGATGANGGYNPATNLTVAPTDGTLRNFAEAQIKDVQQKCFNAGAKPTVIMMHSSVKSTFSGFAGIALNRVDQKVSKTGDAQATILGAADVYQGDFGFLTALANPWQSVRDVALLDPEMWEVGFLRGIKQTPLAKTGDAEKRLVNCEWTLVAKNEASSAVIADVQPTP
ncbi:DUF5309 domain-containing protein [Phyllobacterium calauticae]|uniref:DUF5309 domain-containing protein n=1 Tax=Phyllobacterium calauticae TaxID=2817027 RepID=UPI001CBB7F1C|nr:DUF5309 domain-containing protein [Phyllobacterium calauticae]MBZ3693244.1 DUF5309 domain-containing protein [Phyllobacterium calauticae]